MRLSILMGASMGLTFLDLDLIAAAWTIFLSWIGGPR
jgi:hypothetical protein